jgi:hypothetical protein
MSVAMGTGTTSKREMLWIIILMIFVILAFNRAFGTTTHPTPKKYVRRPVVVKTEACRVTHEGVPRCVTLGTFPMNPNWKVRR